MTSIIIGFRLVLRTSSLFSFFLSSPLACDIWLPSCLALWLVVDRAPDLIIRLPWRLLLQRESMKSPSDSWQGVELVLVQLRSSYAHSLYKGTCQDPLAFPLKIRRIDSNEIIALDSFNSPYFFNLNTLALVWFISGQGFASYQSWLFVKLHVW